MRLDKCAVSLFVFRRVAHLRLKFVRLQVLGHIMCTLVTWCQHNTMYKIQDTRPGQLPDAQLGDWATCLRLDLNLAPTALKAIMLANTPSSLHYEKDVVTSPATLQAAQNVPDFVRQCQHICSQTSTSKTDGKEISSRLIEP